VMTATRKLALALCLAMLVCLAIGVAALPPAIIAPLWLFLFVVVVTLRHTEPGVPALPARPFQPVVASRPPPAA